MKSLRFTLTVSLLALLLSGPGARACWDPWYRPGAYYMYRVVDSAAEPGTVFSSSNVHAEENCRAWQRRCSPDIPLADIYAVVYEMSLEDFEEFRKNRWTYAGNNAFLRWLAHRALEEMDFLLFAKITENVRGQQNSRWYYPTMRTGARMTLEEIAERALAYNGPLRDRYLLQAVRALFSLRRYAECITLWEDEVCLLPTENVMRQMILPYIAGAEHWTGDEDKAVAYYYEAGDIPAMLACYHDEQPLSTVETIERIYRLDPDSRFLPKILQEFIRQAEPTGEFGWEITPALTDEHRKLRRLAVRIAQEGKVADPAMWYYTAAFLEDLDGHTQRASQWLARAERAKGSTLIRESVQVMRIYLDAKRIPYNQAYEARLLEQLQWLDRQIADRLTPEVRERTARLCGLSSNGSYYYWNDMLRRIVLAEVCPRMIAVGKPLRALQLANMADNRLLQLVDRHTYIRTVEAVGKTDHRKGTAVWDPGYRDKMCTESMWEFRRHAHAPDYSNAFFEMIDSAGVRRAAAYRDRILHPRDAFDHFLNERGYVDMDYINDIVGTQCLRERRYQEAANYLGQIDGSFAGHLNTVLEFDPFSYEREWINGAADFKYRFACEMKRLEQIMNDKRLDRDSRAEAMIRYAVGLRNSFGRCWPLTQYYLGYAFYGRVQEKRDWSAAPEAVRGRALSARLIEQAQTLFSDPERAAEALYRLSRYRTLVLRYPETARAQFVRGHCDELRDYVIR